jgi:hypothetical protein
MRTDEDIKRDVEYELKWDPDIDPSDIGVAVKDGAVAVVQIGTAKSVRVVEANELMAGDEQVKDHGCVVRWTAF